MQIDLDIDHVIRRQCRSIGLRDELPRFLLPPFGDMHGTKLFAEYITSYVPIFVSAMR